MNVYNLIKDDIDHTIRNKQHIIQDIFPVEGGVARTKEESGFLKKLP